MDGYPEPPANSRVFGFSPSYRWVIIGSLIAVGLMAFGFSVAILRTTRPSLAIVAIAISFGAFALLTIWAIRHLNESVAISNDGIWYLSGGRKPIFIRWSEVASVEAHDLRNHLAVSDSTGRRRIKLTHQLEDFDELQNLILSRTAERRRSISAARVFHRSYLIFGLFVGCMLMWVVFAVLALRGGQTSVAVWFAGLGALTIYALSREPSRITVSNRSIDIDFIWRRRRSVPFDSVTNIEIGKARSNYSGVSAAVFVDTANGRPLKLAGMREGSIALYDALHSAWNAARNAGTVSSSAFDATDHESQHSEAAAAPQPSALKSLPAVFHLGIRVWASLIGPAVFYSILVLAQELYYARFYPLDWLEVAGTWLALLAAHLLFILIKVPRQVTVSRDSLTVQYTLWRRVLRFGSISAIELTKVRGFRGQRADLVRIRRSNGRTLKLAGMREGAQALYRVLHAAWAADPDHAAAEAGALGDAGSAGYGKRKPGVQFANLFPARLAPAILVLVLAGAAFAVGKVWHLRLPWLTRPAAESMSAADRKALARFPHPQVGWSGAPQPIYSGEIYDHRWNVNYATGAFTYNQTDFFINDSIPINLTRIYTNLFRAPAFGIGMNASYDMFLAGDARRFTYLDLLMPDGAAFYFKRISPGTSWVGSVFRCTAENRGYSGPIKGSKLWWNGDGWTLRLTNGTVMKFPAVRGSLRPGQGAVTSIRDSHGDLLKIERDREGNILRIESPHHADVTFEHDRHNRIIRATDSFGHTVTYSYDNVGRLVAVDDSQQGITRYSYEGHDDLVKVIKPDGKVWLRIKYDAYGRVAKLTFENGSYRRYAYTTNSMGLIVAVKVTSSDGREREVSIVGGRARITTVSRSP